jgi:histidinol-phosphate aminotransferase
MSAGAQCIVAPAKHYGHDLDAMLAAIRPDTRVVWIANPNNPTGNFLPYSEVKAFLQKVPVDVAVVLDEAYNEYLAPSDRVDTLAWIREFPNLIITRTFSKIYGLAGLRVGYAAGSTEVADLLNRVRQPFNVNNLALAAAVAALDDHAFLAESYELNRRGMEQLVAGIKRLGLEHIPSHGNFVAVKVSDGATVNQKLLRQGVIVRPIGGYGLPNHLRVTIGLEQENARFLDALDKALNA